MWLTIGQISKRTRCNIETIRYYEKIGLLPAPPRSEGGYRLYGEDHLKRLTFIRQSRALGFSLDEIRSLLRLVDKGDYTCSEVKEITSEHLDAVRRKISDLRVLEKALEDMVSQCDDGRVPECPVIEALFQASG